MARERQYDEYDRSVTLAWQIANLSNARKLPELKTLFARRGGGMKKQTVGQQKKVLQMLSAQYGLTMRPLKKRKAVA